MATQLDKNIFQGMEIPDEQQYLSCIKCGLCLSVCPTYRESYKEADSPRGRLMLLRKALAGELDLSHNLTDKMYRCLDCLACNAICPVGIKPADLALQARYLIDQAEPQPWVKPLIFKGVFPNANVMETAMLPMFLYQRLGVQSLVHKLGISNALPAQLRDSERMLPRLSRSVKSRVPETTPARGERKYRVAFFLGCFQNLVFSDASAATVRVLAENGCEVVMPKNVKCCGMPHLGYGDVETARSLAKHNIETLEKLNADVIVTDCATCGSTLKEYGHSFFSDDAEYKERAHAFSAKVKDVSEFLGSIQLREPEHPHKIRVTYHDPCHLRRGQNVWKQPRQLLQLSGAELVEMRESDWCCGSAGTQAITHYHDSMQILSRKMQNVARTDATVIASGCPGCQMQLGLGVQRENLPMQVIHPIQLLDRAYQGDGK
jgi:glycolate oxidase iron-sulfur subunit